MKESRGSSLILVVLYVHIILLLAIHMASLFVTMKQISHNDAVRAQVTYAAEAGLYLAGERLLTDPASSSAMLFNLDGISVEVTMRQAGAHQVALSSRASFAPYYVSAAAAIIDTETRKVVDWGIE